MAISNSILDEIGNNSILEMSLLGARTVLEREFRFDNLMIASDDTIKGELAKAGKDNFPYTYIQLADMSGVKDQAPNKTIQRHGHRVGLLGATRATTKKAFVFPVNVSFELKYTDNDPRRVLKIAEAFVILSEIGGLSFNMNIGGFELEFRLDIPENVTIPLADVGNVSAPGGQEVSLQFILHTYAGFFRDVSSVNSDRPIRSYDLTNEHNFD